MTTLTPHQAAHLLGISPKTLKDQRRKGRITGVLVPHPNGDYYGYTPEEVERYRACSLGRPGRRPAASPPVQVTDEA
jgi:hypothetical protein